MVTLETMIGKLNLDRTRIVRVVSHKTEALSGIEEIPVFEGLEEFGPKELAIALEQASECAYRNVVKPVEGTILTVIRDASEVAIRVAKDEVDIVHLLQKIIVACEQSVQSTPDLLPILKQAGKVDAGGYGLQLMFEGMLRHLCGDPVDVAPDRKFAPLDTSNIEDLLEAVDPSQEWEVVIDLQPYEDAMLDIMFEAPSKNDINSCLITDDVIYSNSQPIYKLIKKKTA